MKHNILYSAVLASFLTACGGDSDVGRDTSAATDEIREPVTIALDPVTNTTNISRTFVESDAIGAIDLLEGVDNKGRTTFILNVNCEQEVIDEETGELITDSDGEVRLNHIPPGGVLTESTNLLVIPAAWGPQLQYTAEGAEDFTYICKYDLHNYAAQEVEVVDFNGALIQSKDQYGNDNVEFQAAIDELTDAETGTPPETTTSIVPLYVYREVHVTMQAQEFVAESLIISGDNNIEVPADFSFKLYKFDVLPEETSVKTVTWTSDNTAVATVDPDTGLVTTVAAGTAVISATTDSPENPLTVNRTINVVADTSLPLGAKFYADDEVTEITEINVIEENTIDLDARAFFQDGVDSSSSNTNLTYMSSNEEIVSVDENGQITGGALSGTAQVWAITEDQGLVGALAVNTIADPNILKFDNPNFESGVLDPWITHNSANVADVEANINDISPLQGTYNAKVTSNMLRAFNQAGIKLRYVKPEDNADPAATPRAAPIMRAGRWQMSMSSDAITNYTNNNLQIRLWWDGINSTNGPTSLTEGYYNAGHKLQLVKWGGLLNTNQDGKHVFEFDLDFQVYLYQIQIHAVNGNGATNTTNLMLDWDIDDVRLERIGDLP